MSEFVEVKTAELVGTPLDWAVAEALDEEWPQVYRGVVYVNGPKHNALAMEYRPSTNWAQGGPLWDYWATSMEHYDGWLVAVVGGDAQGPTKLIAICRAIVASQLGDVVQVPKELIND